MRKRLIACALLAASTAASAIVKDVRDSIARNDLAGGNAKLEQYRREQGVTPEFLEALSWMGRGALAAKDYGKAEAYAQRTYDLCVAELKKRPLDQERHLPVALGAAIEVRANVLAAQGERVAAVAFLREQLKRYYSTSIRARVQKNINLLTLEGKPAPAIRVREYVGSPPRTLAQLRGTPVLLFFWAHWCGECKSEIPVLARIASEYGSRLAIVAPTQRYGYVAQGAEAPPPVELKYIDEVRQKYYAPKLPSMQVPVSEEAFKNYGASTTPTIVLVDARGIIRRYHPGKMTYEELEAQIRRLVLPPVPATD
jgi:thiol-disulfide isomerase/thioredoxin